MGSRRTFHASAPGRCGIVGNPSDIYGGSVLSCSIPARASCVLTLGGEERVPSDALLWNAVVRRFPIEGPVAVEWTTDIAPLSGLAGSTALLAATLAAVLAARGEMPDLEDEERRIEFAELVRDIERHEAEIVCGYQDAYMAVHGGLLAMRFSGKYPTHEGPPGIVERIDATLPFLLIMTGVERRSGDVHQPMRERWLAGEPAMVEAMGAIGELTEPGVTALKEGNYPELGLLMDENHRLMQGVGGTGEEVDILIAHCKQLGALGAKLAGAGHGGTVIALAEDVLGLEASLRSYGYCRFMRPAILAGTRIDFA